MKRNDCKTIPKNGDMTTIYNQTSKEKQKFFTEEE